MSKKIAIAAGLAAAMLATALSAQAQQLDSRATVHRDAAEIISRTPDMLRRAKKPAVKGFYRRAVKKHAPVHRAAPSATPAIYASISPWDDTPDGIYKLTVGTDGLEAVVLDDDFNSTYGAVFFDSKFFNITGVSAKACLWDANTWTLQKKDYSEMLNCVNMAYNEADGNVYAIAYPFMPGQWDKDLITIDTDEFVRKETIGQINNSMTALFFYNGTLYGLEEEGALYSIDITDGTCTFVAETDIDLGYGGSAVVDPASNAVFVAANGWDIGLYELDMNDYTAEFIQEFDEDVVLYGMHILAQAPTGVPAQGGDLAFDFPQGALSGSISATAPAITTDGKAITGSLSYSIECNGSEVLTGTVQPGAAFCAAYTVASPALYDFAVSYTSEAGTSVPAHTAVWLGPDAPKPVSNLVLTRENGNNILSWTAPDGAAHAGWLDVEAITYNITRYPDNVNFSGITATSFTDAVPEPSEPEFYSYKVVAVAGEMESDAVVSNSVVAGVVFYNSFDTADDFANMKAEGLVSGGSNWEWYFWRQCASVGYNETSYVEAWLFSPELALEQAVNYRLSFKVWGSNEDYNELISAYIVDTNSAREALAKPALIEKHSVRWESDNKQTLTVDYVVPASDTYYIALRACSAPDLGTIYVDDIMLAKAPSASVPMAPAISASLSADFEVNVSLTAPSQAADGSNLESLAALTLNRDGVAVKTFDNPAPGAVLSFTETLPGEGSYVYSATASNGNGRSEAAQAVVNVEKIGVPNAPVALTAIETDTPGVVLLSWQAPATDVKGHILDKSKLMYAIYDADSKELVAENIIGTSASIVAAAPGDQAFVSYRVAAFTEAGRGAYSAASPLAVVGTQASLPFRESFAGAEFSQLWRFEAGDYSYSEWLLVAASTSPQAYPQDADGGMLAFLGDGLGETADLTSGRIALGSGTNPKLSFWYFAQNSKAGKDVLEVQAAAEDGVFKTLTSFSMRDDMLDGWQKKTVDLAAYAGKTVQLRLRGTSFMTENFMLLDNFEITNISHDLEISGIIAPASVGVGGELKIEALVTNNGVVAANEYSIDLYRDGTKIQGQRGAAIQPGEQKNFVFTLTTDASWAAAADYHVAIAFDADEVPANNTSELKNVAILANTYPTVGAVAAVYTDDNCNAVKVSWTEPDFDDNGDAFTENFEAFTPFEINPSGRWTFVDGDGCETFGSQLFPFTNMGKPMAFITLDADRFNATYAAKSGHKYMASFGAVSGSSNDWMISPELNGEAQTVSFFARSYSDTYGLERFEFLTSDTGIDTGAFKLVSQQTQVPVAWTRYSFEIPAGTKYFAIRCTSNQAFAFFVDDITFIPRENLAKDFEIKGYNVFRDGVKLNASLIEENEFVDSDSPSAQSVYRVSVVYDRGESPMSEGVSPVRSGLDEIGAGITVSTKENTIVISAASPVEVHIFNAAGMEIHAAVVCGTERLTLAPGVYIVQTVGRVHKLILH